MAEREILIWPDPRLKKTAAKVTDFGPDLAKLVDDMLETMYANDGVGLAAPQIGVSQQVIVIDIFAGREERPADAQPLVVINPEFVKKSGTIIWEEGCLSVPGETGDVKRANHVLVRAQNTSGEVYEIEGEELLAVALQHENDHLNGVLFVDHLSKLKRDVIRRKMIKLKAEEEASGSAA